MAFENIQIEHGNFTVDGSGANFYTMDHENTRMLKKTSTGVTTFSFVLTTIIVEVHSLQFDGYYFWSLERQGETGFRIRKWEIGTDDLVRIVDQFSYSTDAVNKYNVYTFAVEWYTDSLDNNALSGETTFDVNDGEVIQPGDEIVIGPSTALGYEGLVFKTTVTAKPTETSVTVNPALGIDFSPNDDLFFTRSFFVFSDDAPGNQAGALYKFRSQDGFNLSLNVSNIYTGVRAATFFQNKVLFVRAGEVIWVNPDSLSIFKSQAIDNLKQSRAEYLTTHDLTGFSNTLYRLEQYHVFYNDGLDRWDTETWAPDYNYNTSSTVPEVYFVAVKADPQLMHRNTGGVPTVDTKSAVYVQVLDQFRTPVFNRIVNFTSTGGSLSSIQETTDLNGEVRTEYTSSSSLGDITITAEVV